MLRSDHKALLFLLVVAIGIMALFSIVMHRSPLPEEGDMADSLEVKHESSLVYDDAEPQTVHLQSFDPNTADSTTLLSLGLSPYMVRSVYRYRAKGGIFRTPEDVARIPGMTQKQYRELLPYVHISDDYRPATELVGDRHFQHSPSESAEQYPKKIGQNERLSVNSADTTQLRQVPGIGSYYARKIVDLRRRLGGFVSLSQLLQIEGFPESALQYLTIPDGGITRLNINRATFRQLSTHPYIGYERTKQIFEYRRLKGKITSLHQLTLLPGFTEKEIEQMEPYIEY